MQRTKAFSIFNQPLSVQLNNTMQGEEEKLLSRCLRSSHITNINKKANAANNATKDITNKENTRKTAKERCAVVGCTDMREADREIHHTQYDDTVGNAEINKCPER